MKSPQPLDFPTGPDFSAPHPGVWSGQGQSGLAPSLVWITGHHPLLNAAIQVTSDEVHKPVGRDVYS